MTIERDLEKQEARDMNRDPITGAPGSHPVGTGIGAAGAGLAGAAVGSVVGPIGTLVGGVVGVVVGGLVGSEVGEEVNPTAVEEEYWRVAHVNEPYYNSSFNFDDYRPAYRLGYESRGKSGVQAWDEQQEDILRSEWQSSHGSSRLTWQDARQAAQAGWTRVGR
jgi:uncharacterized protein YcfJ